MFMYHDKEGEKRDGEQIHGDPEGERTKSLPYKERHERTTFPIERETRKELHPLDTRMSKVEGDKEQYME